MNALFIKNTPDRGKLEAARDLLNSKAFAGLEWRGILSFDDGTVAAALYYQDGEQAGSVRLFPWDLEKLSFIVAIFYDTEDEAGRLFFNETAGTFEWCGNMPGDYIADICAPDMAGAIEYVLESR